MQGLELRLTPFRVVDDKQDPWLLSQGERLFQRLLTLADLLNVVRVARRLQETSEPILAAQPAGRFDQQPRLAEASWAMEQPAGGSAGSIATPGEHVLGEAGGVDVGDGFVLRLQQLRGSQVTGIAIKRCPLGIEQVDAERFLVMLMLRLGRGVRPAGPHAADRAQQPVRLSQVECVDVKRAVGRRHRRNGEIRRAGVGEFAGIESLVGLGQHIR